MATVNYTNIRNCLRVMIARPPPPPFPRRCLLEISKLHVITTSWDYLPTYLDLESGVIKPCFCLRNREESLHFRSPKVSGGKRRRVGPAVSVYSPAAGCLIVLFRVLKAFRKFPAVFFPDSLCVLKLEPFCKWPKSFFLIEPTIQDLPSLCRYVHHGGGYHR